MISLLWMYLIFSYIVIAWMAGFPLLSYWKEMNKSDVVILLGMILLAPLFLSLLVTYIAVVLLVELFLPATKK